MRDGHIKISVVIPIYNVEKYLQECMDSVVHQTLKDIEIICMDDGSTDRSGKIVDEYAQADSRVRVIHKENTGYGNSMNIGLENARGKYIAIVESDDFITSNILQDLYENAERENAEVVKSDFAFFSGEKGNYEIIPAQIYGDSTIYGKVLNETEEKLFKGHIAHWTCLYNKEFLEKNHIKFHETPGASYQDTGFWFQTLMYADRFYMHDNYYYHYRCDNLNSSMLNKGKVYCISREYDYIFEIVQSSESIFRKYLPEYIMCRFIGHRDTIARIGDEFKREFIIHMSESFRDLRNRGLLDTATMEKTDEKQLLQIMENPEKFYEEKMNYSQKLQKILSPYEKLYIYGAGSKGRKIYRNMKESDRKKTVGFLVSKKQCDFVDNLNVYEWNEIKQVDIKTGIIVGVTKRYEAEIVNILKQANVLNIILLSD